MPDPIPPETLSQLWTWIAVAGIPAIGYGIRQVWFGIHTICVWLGGKAEAVVEGHLNNLKVNEETQVKLVSQQAKIVDCIGEMCRRQDKFEAIQTEHLKICRDSHGHLPKDPP